jgi:hypothetical protein
MFHMETRSRKHRHMLLSNPKPIKHNLLENYYIEKKAEINSSSMKAKRQNPYKKWPILAAALSLLLIIAAWFAFSPQQEDESKIIAQASPSPSTDSPTESEPTDFTDLGSQQTDNLDPETVSETTNQPSPKKQNNSTESTPKKPPETNAAPKTSVDRPSRPSKQTDQKKPAEPTNPPPPQSGNKPQEKKKPECKPSIWNLFRCN